MVPRGGSKEIPRKIEDKRVQALGTKALDF